MLRTPEPHASERGAVLVHVALALLALMSLSTFIIDYGVLWSSRRQAQNAADAAALAGAVGLAFDGTHQAAIESANAMIAGHGVWGQTPAATVTTRPCPSDADLECFVDVYVYRDQAHNNALPMIFGQLLGLRQQGVRAFATAEVATGNTARCFKPWALADKWLESAPGGWGPLNSFDPLTGDSYVAPTSTSPGTGFDVRTDHGRLLTLQVGVAGPGPTITGGWFRALKLEPSDTPQVYHNSITECLPLNPNRTIGATLVESTVPYPTLQFETGSAVAGTAGLIAQDSGATWDPTANGGRGGVINSCAQWTTPCLDSTTGLPVRMSPRVVALPVFNLSTYLNTPGNPIVISNILGFFVDSVDASNNVRGYIVTIPGIQIAAGATVHGPASLLKQVSLIR